MEESFEMPALRMGEAVTSSESAAHIVKTKARPWLGTAWWPLGIVQPLELHPDSNPALSSPYQLTSSKSLHLITKYGNEPSNSYCVPTLGED